VDAENYNRFATAPLLLQRQQRSDTASNAGVCNRCLQRLRQR